MIDDARGILLELIAAPMDIAGIEPGESPLGRCTLRITIPAALNWCNSRVQSAQAAKTTSIALACGSSFGTRDAKPANRYRSRPRHACALSRRDS
jgi:hypothetical protein